MTASGAALAAGLGALAVAGLVDLAVGARWPRLRRLPYLTGAAGAVCLAVAGAGALAGHPARLTAAGWPGAGWLGAGTAGLAADRLSGLFLVIVFGAAAAVSLAFADWAARPGAVGRRGLGASYALTLGAVAVVITAVDAFTFLLAWELVTAGFYLLAGFERGGPGRPGGALATLVFGKISGAALLVGLLLLVVRSGSLDLATFAHVPGGVARATAQALLIAGFAVKVGLVPFQVWLPRGYTAAPGPARAVMAGIAVNIGFYGLWRTLALLGAPPAWLTGLLLVLAGLTALLGIAHAAVQPGLQRVIAYSSVENSGLILAGYGVALVGVATRDGRLAAAGLLAATLQIIAHTAAKSLLFTASTVIAPRGTAGVEAPGDDDLDALRGAARRLPWSGTGLAIGSLTLAGLPLTVGFAAEWFLLEALMQQFRIPGLGFRLVLALAGAAVALTVGFAGVTFVRLTGLVVLGPPASPPPRPVAPGPGVGRPGLRLAGTGRDRHPRGRLPRHRRRAAAGDPGGGGRVVPGGAHGGDLGRAEVPLGGAAGLRRLLDPVALVAVGGHAADGARGDRLRPAGEQEPADAGTAGARVALGHRRGGGRGLLHRNRLRQPGPPRAGECPAHAGRGAAPRCRTARRPGDGSSRPGATGRR